MMMMMRGEGRNAVIKIALGLANYYSERRGRNFLLFLHGKRDEFWEKTARRVYQSYHHHQR